MDDCSFSRRRSLKVIGVGDVEGNTAVIENLRGSFGT